MCRENKGTARQNKKFAPDSRLFQRDKVGLRVKTKAFLPEEGGTAQAVTEGAARGQIRMRVSLIRQV